MAPFKFLKLHFLPTLVILACATQSQANRCGDFYLGKVEIKASKEKPLIFKNGQLKLPKNLTSDDPFEILGISKDEKENEESFDGRLKKRARKLLMTYHSDRAENILLRMFEDETTRKAYFKETSTLLDLAFRKIKEAFDSVKTADLRSNFQSEYTHTKGGVKRDDAFDGYFENFSNDIGSSIINLELNDRAFTMQNIRPIIDAVRKVRSFGQFKWEQSLNSSYSIGYLKTAINKARRYIKKTYPKEYSEDAYRKSIEYFIVEHLGIFSHKFSFQDFLNVYEYGQHPKVKAMIATSALLQADSHYPQNERTSVKYAILSHLISDLNQNNPVFFKTLDGEKLMKYVVSEHSELRPTLAGFIKVWLTELPGFLKGYPASKNDKSMLAFFDLMDLERNDLPLKYLEEVSNGLLPSRARGLARELLRWDDVLALPQI